MGEMTETELRVENERLRAESATLRAELRELSEECTRASTAEHDARLELAGKVSWVGELERRVRDGEAALALLAEAQATVERLREECGRLESEVARLSAPPAVPGGSAEVPGVVVRRRRRRVV